MPRLQKVNIYQMVIEFRSADRPVRHANQINSSFCSIEIVFIMIFIKHMTYTHILSDFPNQSQNAEIMTKRSIEQPLNHL